MGARFQSFAEFYPYYLAEHNNATNRRCHFLGQVAALAVLGVALATRNWWLLLAVPVAGYGCSWIGHFYFERNRPATFRYPLYSFLGDWVMAKDMLTGRIKF